MQYFQIKAISELCIEYQFGTTIDQATNQKVLNTYSYLQNLFDFNTIAITDIVPTYTTLAIHFLPHSPLFNDMHYLDQPIKEGLHHQNQTKNKTFEINVSYDGEDIDTVATTLNLSKQELIQRHANRPYTIAMLGFKPYFPYLLGLDQKLFIPRKDTPRPHVKQGAVAIAAGQTGIYSQPSPGGWHILGYTDFNNFDQLRPADIIIFKEIKRVNKL
jgi:KipI family sensor histidine kinase inhibitor